VFFISQGKRECHQDEKVAGCNAGKFHEEGAESKRLQQDHVRAEINSNAVLTRRGMESRKLSDANETVWDSASHYKAPEGKASQPKLAGMSARVQRVTDLISMKRSVRWSGLRGAAVASPTGALKEGDTKGSHEKSK
jgi:hypothetical protein